MKPHLELLELLGYEPAGEDPDDRVKTLWTYQRTLPHVVISLPPDACVMDVNYAIYDAGRESERRSLYEDEKAIRDAEQAYKRKLSFFGRTEIKLPPVTP